MHARILAAHPIQQRRLRDAIQSRLDEDIVFSEGAEVANLCEQGLPLLESLPQRVDGSHDVLRRGGRLVKFGAVQHLDLKALHSDVHLLQLDDALGALGSNPERRLDLTTLLKGARSQRYHAVGVSVVIMRTHAPYYHVRARAL